MIISNFGKINYFLLSSICKEVDYITPNNAIILKNLKEDLKLSTREYAVTYRISFIGLFMNGVTCLIIKIY